MWFRRKLNSKAIVLVTGFVALCCRGVTTNILVNPGFELASTPLQWNSYGQNVYVETSATITHSGSNYLKVYQAFNGALNYTGVYQDNLSGPGAVYAAD